METHTNFRELIINCRPVSLSSIYDRRNLVIDYSGSQGACHPFSIVSVHDDSFVLRLENCNVLAIRLNRINGHKAGEIAVNLGLKNKESVFLLMLIERYILIVFI
ncbi:MAG TPA: hypothetical protein DDY43_13565 [Synechococcales bacterium UBA10510]|nr:hypothetical protein [Synechococcales bacterium UBA10510]